MGALERLGAGTAHSAAMSALECGVVLWWRSVRAWAAVVYSTRRLNVERNFCQGGVWVGVDVGSGVGVMPFVVARVLLLQGPRGGRGEEESSVGLERMARKAFIVWACSRRGTRPLVVPTKEGKKGGRTERWEGAVKRGTGA
ncbi:hypothetical protein DFP72DRAFT_70410 [Ephemerocybe angulata]|uniref:Uncharacterized protein n=1 Tax=Ephemerocybe angulata TaxID=980116 RepID=A0A8H6HCS1_9AGAR|nr:hypothetical protein DFP72DRAFT_70410 [Tulosesus angulatus]